MDDAEIKEMVRALWRDRRQGKRGKLLRAGALVLLRP